MGTQWSVQDENVADSDWEVSDLNQTLNTKTERDAWTAAPSALSPNATKRSGILGAANWDAEDFRQNPEDVELEPEFTQADNDGWTLVDPD